MQRPAEGNIIGNSGNPDPDAYADYGNLPRVFHHELVAALNNGPELMDRINHAIHQGQRNALTKGILKNHA